MFSCGNFAAEIYFVFVISMCRQCVQINAVLSLQEYVIEACYGITFDDFLQPSCNATDVLYIRDVYTYAKPKSWNCPQLSTTLDRNDQLCCRYMNESVDCGWRYYGDSLSTHYTNCVGRQTCQVQVSWNETSQNCNQTYFMDKTNYMRQYFHCINRSNILDICTTSTETGNLLYIWSDGYPATGSGCSTSSGCLCSVSASGNSQIQIGTLDIRFQNDSSCHQSLHITDGLSQYSIDCNHKSDFSFSAVYTSQTSSISIRFDNTHDTNGGQFWVSVQAVDISSSLTMTCGTGSAVYTCGDVITATTASTVSSSLSSTSYSAETDTTVTTTTETVISSDNSTESTTASSSSSTSTVSTSTSSTASTTLTTTTTTSVDELSTTSLSTVTTATTSSSTTLTTESSSDTTNNSSNTETLNHSGSSSSVDKTWMIAGAVGGAVLLHFAFVSACLIRYRCKRRTQSPRRITPRPKENSEEYPKLFVVKNVPRNMPPNGHNRNK